MQMEDERKDISTGEIETLPEEMMGVGGGPAATAVPAPVIEDKMETAPGNTPAIEGE